MEAFPNSSIRYWKLMMEYHLYYKDFHCPITIKINMSGSPIKAGRWRNKRQ